MHLAVNPRTLPVSKKRERRYGRMASKVRKDFDDDDDDAGSNKVLSTETEHPVSTSGLPDGIFSNQKSRFG
jgi:hypothetical protein